MPVPFQHTPTHDRNERPVYDMALPFDPNSLRQSAESQGMSRHDAAVFAHLALSKLRSIHEETGQPVTVEQIAEAIKQHCKDEYRRSKPLQSPFDHLGMSISDAMELECRRASPTFRDPADADKVRLVEVKQHYAARKRFQFNERGLEEYFDGKDPYEPSSSSRDTAASSKLRSRDFFSALSEDTELAVEVGKYLRPRDILNLCIASRRFHNTVHLHLLSCIRSWINYQCPEAGRVFAFQMYKRLLVPDPAMRTWAQQYNDSSGSLPGQMREVRSVPGLKYMQLVVGRHKCCRDIVAILARNGHRAPPTMYKTLLRLWLLMELATSHQRRALLRNKSLWTDCDLYNAQLLFIKLGMHFNDPVYGPNTYELLHLMMGQKGLYPLWQLLMRKRFTRLPEILELKVRYDFEIPPDHWGGNFFGRKVHGVPVDEVGLYHLESWGKGRAHLMRPDELVPFEAVSRGLELDKHLMHMVTWGYFDWRTGENLVPSEEEMYISDEEEAVADMDTHHHWKKRHVLKKRFHFLSAEQQQEIRAYDEDERLRAMGWCGDDVDDSDDYDGP